MKITVSFNVAGDMEALFPADWVAAEDMSVDMSFVPQKPGCFDESALEFGLRLAGAARAAGEDTVLRAVSVGGWERRRWMKTLYALGYDECILPNTAADLRFDPVGLSEILAGIDAIKESDVILLGDKGSLGGSGQVGPLLAERLGLPFYGGISALAYDGKELVVSAVSGDFVVTRSALPRAVLAIGNAPFSMLRVPTLKDRMKSAQRVIREYDCDFMPDGTAAQLVSLEPASANSSRGALSVAGESAAERAAQILAHIREAAQG